MDTRDYEIAIRKTVKDWEFGRIDARGAMDMVAHLVRDWKPLEDLSVVYPAKGSVLTKIGASEAPPE